MGQSPFAKHPTSEELGASRRRSTRVDYACAIIISGRDATGRAFSERTETSVVNLHGCKLRTTYSVLVGMQVVIACPASGLSENAICMRIWESVPGETMHDIAVQLVKPQNLWGVENPPADWQAVSEMMVYGRRARPERNGHRTPVPERAALSAPAASRVPSPTVGAPAVKPPLAEASQPSGPATELVLQKVRAGVDEILRTSLETFRQQVEALVKDAEERIAQRAERSYEEVESSLGTLRADLAEQLTQRTEQMVKTAEAALRDRLREMFGTLLKSAPDKPREPASRK